MTITNANSIHARATPNAILDRITNLIWSRPPAPHHAANTNIICQANGLKYQVAPCGYDGRFQSNHLAKMYRTTEASNVTFGRRTMHHIISGAANTSDM